MYNWGMDKGVARSAHSQEHMDAGRCHTMQSGFECAKEQRLLGAVHVSIHCLFIV